MAVYLDIETLDFFSDPHIKTLPRNEQLQAMRLGCAVTYDAQADMWEEWTAEQSMDLCEALILRDCPIVGWNVQDFDWPVITSNARRAGWNPFGFAESAPPFVDLFAEIRRTTGRWYKLEDVCQSTLGRGKLADGQQAAEWLRSGDPELIRKALTYCRHDVELTVSLHSRLLSGDPLRLLPRAQRQELNEILWRLDGYERLPDAMGAISTK